MSEKKKSKTIKEKNNLDAETAALGVVFYALLPLSKEAQLRVVAAAFTLCGESEIASLLIEHRNRIRTALSKGQP